MDGWERMKARGWTLGRTRSGVKTHLILEGGSTATCGVRCYPVRANDRPPTCESCWAPTKEEA